MLIGGKFGPVGLLASSFEYAFFIFWEDKGRGTETKLDAYN